MAITPSLLGVAQGCTPEVAQVLAERGLTAPLSGGCPGTVNRTAREVKRMPADQAESTVPYLGNEVLGELFDIDSRVGVRDRIVHQGPRLDGDAAVKAYKWATSKGGYGHAVLTALVSRMSDDQLMEIMVSAGSYPSAPACASLVSRVRDRQHLEELLVDEDLSQRVGDHLLGAALSGAVEGVDFATACQLAGDRLGRVVAFAPDMTVEMAAAGLRDADLAGGMGTRFQYGTAATVHEEVWQMLGDELADGPLWNQALAMWTTLRGNLKDALDASGLERVRQQVPARKAATLLGTLSLDDEWIRMLQDRMADEAGQDPWLAERLCETCRFPEVLARVLETSEGQTRQTVARHLARRARREADLAPLVPVLLGDVDVPVTDKAALLRPDTDPRTVAEVVDELISQAREAGSRNGDLGEAGRNLVGRVRLEQRHLAQLGSLVHLSAWMSGGTDANPFDAEVAAEIMRSTGDPFANVQSLTDIEGVLDACVARALEHTDVARNVFGRVELDDEVVRSLLAAHPEDMADRILAGTSANPATVARRAMVLDHGGWSGPQLARSFAETHPTADERPALRELLEGAGNDSRTVDTVLGKLELEPDELVVALRGAPRLIPVWVQGATATPFDLDVLVSLYDEVMELHRDDLLATVHLLAGDPDTRERLVGDRRFLAALQGGRWTGNWGQPSPVSALRLCYELVHDAVDGDPMAWQQVAAQLDSWPGSLDELLIVAAVACEG